jgi:hypothetical protein
MDSSVAEIFLLPSRRIPVRMSEAQADFTAATLDGPFKELFSPEGPEGSTVLCHFLRTFIGLDLSDVRCADLVIPTQSAKKRRVDTTMDGHYISADGTHCIMEMQNRSHERFDQRALFYACATYSNQVIRRSSSDSPWFESLRPVYAVQVLGYIPERGCVARFDAGVNPDGSGEHHVAINRHYISRFSMKDSRRGEAIDTVQMMQIELPRAQGAGEFFPPKIEFSAEDWWISLLLHSRLYTAKLVDDFRPHMPAPIHTAFMRLRRRDWSLSVFREYDRSLMEVEEVADNEVGNLGVYQRDLVVRLRRENSYSDAGIARIVELPEARVRSILSDCAPPLPRND